MMGHDRLKKVVLVIFPRNPLLTQLCNLGRIWAKINATLCPRQLCLMIHSLKILKCSMLGYSSQTKLLLVNLPKTFPFWLRAFWAQFGPHLSNLMSHDSFSGDLFVVFWHNEVQKIDKISLNHFSKNLLLGQYGPNLAQNCTMLHQINCSRDFKKYSSMMWCNSQTLVTFVNFPKKFFFQTSGN